MVEVEELVEENQFDLNHLLESVTCTVLVVVLVEDGVEVSNDQEWKTLEKVMTDETQ